MLRVHLLAFIDSTTPLNNMRIVRNILVINRDRVSKIVVVIIILHLGLFLMSGHDGPIVVRGDFAQTDAAEGFQVNHFFIRQVFLSFQVHRIKGEIWESCNVVICLFRVHL